MARIETRKFRNLTNSEYRFDEGSHLVLGNNGAGKTSLLEAIYLLATSRSFRTPRIADCCSHGALAYHISGEVEVDRRARLDLHWSNGQCERLVNGSKVALAEYLRSLPVVCWSLGNADVLVGPPSARRRFLDRGVLGLRPSAIQVLSRYRKALQEKRQLLKQGSDGLSVWNEVLANAAAELVQLRSKYVEQLRSALQWSLETCNLDLGCIELAYKSSLESAMDGAGAIFSELMSVREQEQFLRRPILGPHRDDLVIRWDEHDPKLVASAGERKALGLVLLAAHGRVVASAGCDVTYLLDDLDTELDEERLVSLWGLFSSARQLFVTSNRDRVWAQIAIDFVWNCSAGSLILGESEGAL